MQKYRSSVKALIHNSPPSVHSTCCVIKAVLYPLLLPLVSISPTLSFSCRCARFFFLIVRLFLRVVSHSLVLFSCSLCCPTAHTLPVLFLSSAVQTLSSPTHQKSSLSLCLPLSLSPSRSPDYFCSAHCLHKGSVRDSVHLTANARSRSALPQGQFAFFPPQFVRAIVKDCVCPPACVTFVLFILSEASPPQDWSHDEPGLLGGQSSDWR